MPILLALDTAGSRCSVALLHDAGEIEHTRIVERAHNQVLLPMVEALFAEAGMQRNAVDLVAFGAGPGSFTGVRIAAAAAQGIALGCAAAVIPVPSALVLARRALVQTPRAPAGVLALTRSRAANYYYAAYAVVEGGLREVLASTLYEGPTDLPLGVDASWLAVGDRPDWWTDVPVPFLPDVEPTAMDVAQLAMAAWHRGEALDAAEGLPIYVSGDSPWRPAAKPVAKKGS